MWGLYYSYTQIEILKKQEREKQNQKSVSSNK